MPLSFRQAGNTFIQGPNISIYPSGNSYAISGNAPSTGGGFTGLTSAGTGNRLIVSPITNNDLIYKSLTGTSNLSINDNENGTLIFSLEGGTGTIISGRNVGTNVNSLSFFSGLTTTTNPNDTLVFRNISGGPNIFISRSVDNDGDILISRGSPILVNQISNIGDGARVLSSITLNSAITRTLANASGFSSALGVGIITTIPTSSTDSDSTAFITAANITDARQIAAIENLVTDLKTANIWNKMLAIYPLVGGTANSHKYNLKDPRDLDAAYRLDFGSQNVFHDSNGIRSDAANGVFQPTINTFIQLNLVSSLTNNIHVSFYSRTNVNNTPSPNAGGVIGNSSNNGNFRFYPNYNGAWITNLGDNGFNSWPNVSDSLGFYIASRTSSTGNTYYKNGFLSAMTSNTVHLSSITGTILLMRFNFYPENSRQMAFYSFGSGLTNSEALAYTTAVENYQTTLSRQVIALQNQTVRIAPTNTTASLLYISNATSQLGTSALFGADFITGSLGIGGAAVTTSRLPIAAGTGVISQIRLTAFSATPTPTDGNIWYSTSGNTLKFYKNNISTDFIFNDNNLAFSGYPSILAVDTGGTITPKYVNSLGEFNALTSLTVNTGEASIISSSLIGSTTLLSSTNPYNPQLGIGRKFRFNAKGILSFDIVPLPINLNIIIKLGSIVISSSSTISVGNGIDAYTSEIEIDATFTIRNSGLVVCSGKILFLTSPPSTAIGDPVIFGLYSQNATISTTTDQIFDCIVQLDPEEVTNTITINESTLEVLN